MKFLSLLLLTSNVFAALSGKVFELNNPQNLLFSYTETKTQHSKGEVIQTLFVDPGGKAAVAETIVFSQNKLSQYTIEQKQLGFINLLKIQDGKAHYIRKNLRTGETDQDEDDWGDNYIVIPELIPFTVSHWDSLTKGDSASFKLCILERMDTYSFSISKDSETVVDGKKAIVFKIAPSSIFISAILSPFYLTVDSETQKPLKFTGQGLPKVEKGPSDLRDLEADLIYTL